MSLAIDTFPKERFGLITGSKCEVLFPDKGDGVIGMNSYAKKLANEMYFQYYDEVQTWQMEHGSMGEHFAFEHYKTYYDDSIVKGEFIQLGDYGGSPDAEVDAYGLDFKCATSLGIWLDYFHKGISKQQMHQAQMYMHLRKKNTWKVCSYLTETQFMNDNGLVYPVPEPKRLIINEVKRDVNWGIRLNDIGPSVISLRDSYIGKLKEKFG